MNKIIKKYESNAIKEFLNRNKKIRKKMKRKRISKGKITIWKVIIWKKLLQIGIPKIVVANLENKFHVNSKLTLDAILKKI